MSKTTKSWWDFGGQSEKVTSRRFPFVTELTTKGKQLPKAQIGKCRVGGYGGGKWPPK